MEKDIILNFKVDELKEELRKLELTTTGNKADLQKRLLEACGYDSDVTNDDQRVVKNNKVAENKNDDVESDISHESVEIKVEENSNMVNRNRLFTLNDIRDSLSSFDGNSQLSVETWLEEFEENAETVGWDSVQRFIYAKQLIKGAAKIFIRGQAGISSWSDLKNALLSEFGEQLTAINIHKKLQTRRKKPNESYLEYLYTLIEIGSKTTMDEQSIIEYFVDGINDSVQNKTLLYDANSLAELKMKIRTYEKVRKTKMSYSRYTENNINPNKLNKVCTKCPHLKNHATEECRKLNNRCFKCGEAGHRIAECRQNVAKSSQNNSASTSKQHPVAKKNEDQVNKYQVKPANDLQKSGSSVKVFKQVQIGDVKFEALMDTGSDLCLIAKSVYDSLDDYLLFPHEINLRGIGQGKMQTLGYILAKAKIDNVEFIWTFYVVNDSDLLGQCLLGNDLLAIVDILFSDKGATLRLKEKQDSLEHIFFEEVLVHKSEYDKRFVAGRVFSRICQDRSIEVEDQLQSIGTVSEITKAKLSKLIAEYEPKKTEVSEVTMKIVLTDEIPVSQKYRRLPISDQKIVEAQIDNWLEEGIIQPSNSEFAAPIVLVRKKDGSKRLCCDYRQINKKIVKDNYPMVLMDDVLHKLVKAKYFSTMDLKNGFFHVSVEKDSQKYTSFVTHYGQFKFTVAPFGMKNSPAVFCRFIAHIFHELIQDGSIIVYMDDIVIPSQTENENLGKIAKMLQVASKHGIQINWKKCQFIKTEISFLGYIISDSSIKPSPEKIKAVANYKTPNDVKSVQRFIGLTSYFRRFIEDFAVKAKPLTDLMCKNVPFTFGDEQIIACEQLKQALVKEPVLKLFNPEAITELHADASKWGYGAALLQKDSEDGQFHPIEYMSRKTTPCEQNYSSYELEVLAIINALKKWRIYLLGIKFKIVTDCSAFTQTVKKRELPDRIARWVILLEEFDYTLEHRQGTKLKHVDALSRVQNLMVDSSLKHSIIDAQESDEHTSIIKEYVKSNGYKDFYIKHNILFKNPAIEQIVVPEAMEKEVIELAHRQGHFAAKKTAELIAKNFYIKKLNEKVEKCIKNCIQCIMMNNKSGKKEGFLSTIEKSDSPLETLHIDHVGPLEATKKQYNHILVVVDAFSKFVWLYPTKSTGAEEVVNKLQKQAELFGNPDRIISDRGTAFTAKIFEEFCVENHIQHYLITTGVPRGNGQVERMHKIVIAVLAKLCEEKPQLWYKHVGEVQQIMNSSPSRATKLSPFKILTGLEMKTKCSLKIKEMIEFEQIKELQEEISNTRMKAKENILKIQEENKKGYDKNRKEEIEYKENDLVAIKRTQYGVGLKLKAKYLGPYVITKKLKAGRYLVKKIGQFEGPNETSTVCEFMKPWRADSRSNPLQDGRM